MGQQVSVETFTSSKDTDGHKYWASFDPYPFKVGNKKLVYMGILNGEGPLKGQKCVVKTVRRGAISEQDWFLESNRAVLARDMARSFNKIIPRHERKITFNCPIMAEIDTLSDCLCINDVLGKPKKKWKDSEHVSIELYLKGHFEDYEYGWVPAKDLLVPESFSHYTWCKSEGTLLVSNLQGVMNQDAYHFTGPTVHSDDKRFGNSDLGHKGIKGFFKLHRCNRVCKHWPRLGDCIDLRGWGEHWGKLIEHGGSPSAPPSPHLGSLESPPPYVSYTNPGGEGSRCRGEMTSRPGDISPTSYPPEGILPRNQMQPRPPLQSRYPLMRQNTPIQQGGTMWRRIGDQGFLIDWREEFLNHAPVHGQDNPMFQNELFGMQLMWVIKQMSYAVYAPPPPYSIGGQPEFNGLPEYRAIEQQVPEKNDYYAGIDSPQNQPPPYSEENVDPNLEFVTYL